MSAIKGQGAIDRVKYISKDEALKELKASLKDADYILEGLDENPLPASIEIRMKKEAVGPESAKSYADSLRKMEGIDDVQYGEKFLLSLHSMKSGDGDHRPHPHHGDAFRASSSSATAR